MKKKQMIAKARMGDEEAIEKLTLEDIDMYSMVSQTSSAGRCVQHCRYVFYALWYGMRPVSDPWNYQTGKQGQESLYW